jgi:glycosyltransferase involved in cell wall biosynthesis
MKNSIQKLDCKKVEILLSSYNGERYIDTQLESIFSQTYKNITVSVRDDGSSDDTINILNNYKRKFKNLKIKASNNVGPTESFFQLLKDVDSDSLYVAFADQDDLWFDDKISKAIECIQDLDPCIPVLYCSNVSLTDSELNITKDRRWDKDLVHSFYNALLENFVQGCTIVLNRAAVELINSRTRDSKDIILHDWWIYLTCSMFGLIVYDNKPSMLYRLHTENVAGHTEGLKLFVRRIQRLISHDSFLDTKQVAIFLDCYRDIMPKTYIDFIEIFIYSCNHSNFLVRMNFFRKTACFKQSLVSDFLLKVLLSITPKK